MAQLWSCYEFPILSFSEHYLTSVNLTNNIILLLQYFMHLTLYVFNIDDHAIDHSKNVGYLHFRTYNHYKARNRYIL